MQTCNFLSERAITSLSEQKKLLNQLVENLEPEQASFFSGDYGLHLYELTLQYRLSQENILTALLIYHQNLCRALGIEPENSYHQNLEAAITALGHDVLMHELAFLSKLKNLLEHAYLHKLKREKNAFFKQLPKDKQLKEIENSYFARKQEQDADKKDKVHQSVLTNCLRQAIGAQAYLQFNIEQLTKAFHAFGGSPQIGPDYDYITTLKGPAYRIFDITLELTNLTKQISNLLAYKLGLVLEDKLVAEKLHEFNHFLKNQVLTNPTLAPTVESGDLLANRFKQASYKRRTMNLFAF